MNDQLKQEYTKYFIHQAKVDCIQGKISEQRRDELIQQYKAGHLPKSVFVDTHRTVDESAAYGNDCPNGRCEV